MANTALSRENVDVGGREISYLHVGEGTPVLLLHGTFWSRVWQPVIERIGQDNEVFALDFPGFGRSGGKLSREEAEIPALAGLVLRAAEALGVGDSFAVAGHDIGGAVAQHVAVSGRGRVGKLALVNSVLYDSWPVPAVSRFRDPELAENITPEELVELRRGSMGKAISRDLSSSEEEDYLSPWRTENGTRSWTALAAAADARYTLDLVEPLKELGLPTLLVWGEEDEFQPISYAERFEREMPNALLTNVPGARHIPMEDDPDQVGSLLADFFAGR